MPLFVKNRLIEAIAPFSTTGLTVSTILYDESRNPTNGTATEIGITGNYYYSFTPDTDGDWRLVMYNGSEKHTFHFPVYSSLKTSSTHSITTTNDTIETQIFEIAKSGTYALTVMFDLDTLETAVEGGTITIRLYNKIDGSNYSDKPSARIDYVVGTGGSTAYPSLEALRLGQYSRVTIQCSSDVTTTRIISYYYIVEDLGV
jgi:hypothetical protein